MMKTVTEAEIASRIDELLRRNLSEAGSGLRLLRVETEKKIGKVVVDALTTIELPGPGRQRGILLIEAKRVGEPVHLSQAIIQLKSYLTAWEAAHKGSKPEGIGLLVVAPFVSERGRQLCKDQGVGYMDLAGNCRFTLGQYTLDKMGRENPKKEQKEARTIFSPKAARIVRALLEEPARRWTLSELAQETGVSLGQAHKVIKKLEAELFVLRDEDRKVALDKPAELVDAWASNHRVADQATHAFFSFQQGASAFMKQLARVAADEKLEYALTLHAGASLIAPFMRFNETHFYARKRDLETWATRLDLRPVQAGGNVQIIIPRDDGVFYKKQTVGGAFVVSNVQLYVDLAGYPARGKEQADVLRERALKY